MSLTDTAVASIPDPGTLEPSGCPTPLPTSQMRPTSLLLSRAPSKWASFRLAHLPFHLGQQEGRKGSAGDWGRQPSRRCAGLGNKQRAGPSTHWPKLAEERIAFSNCAPCRRRSRHKLGTQRGQGGSGFGGAHVGLGRDRGHSVRQGARPQRQPPTSRSAPSKAVLKPFMSVRSAPRRLALQGRVVHSVAAGWRLFQRGRQAGSAAAPGPGGGPHPCA